MKAFLCLALLSLPLTTAFGQSPQKLIIYKKFVPAGTTMRLLGAFRQPSQGVDTTNTNRARLISLQEWDGLLARARVRKHRQMKISGVEWAGEMLVQQQRHFFLVCSPNLIIDLTARVNYWLAAPDHQTLDARLSLLTHHAR
ncbi:hypothetical protein ACW9KT_18770 [Hymenobacter sp. HD11105]